MNTVKMKNNSNSVFDIAKFIMSLMVVAIHAQLYPELLYPWLRVAVPMFFMLSSYFLFGKLSRMTDQKKKDEAVRQYAMRNLTLYLFYAVLFFPIYVREQQWFSQGIGKGMVLMLRELIFGSTFPASWFVMACVIGTLLVYYGGKCVSDPVLALISLAVYAVVSIRSAYTFAIEDIPAIMGFYTGVENVIVYIMLSFPVALFWIVCGKLFAENKINLKLWSAVVGTVISGIALYLEADYVDHQIEGYFPDCYLLMVPFAVMVFAVIRQITIPELRWGIYLRKISVIIFTTHIYTLRVTGAVLRKVGLPSVLLQYALTVCICVCIGLVILWLEKKHGFGWLKYSH